MRGDRSSNQTAAGWIARLNADTRTDGDEADFRRWLAADPGHAAEFERATDLWEMVGGTMLERARQRAPILTRRRLIAGLVAGAGAGGIGLLAIEPAFAATRYETGIGEQRRVTFVEGSSMLLDAQTRVRALLTAQSRRLWLTEGRISLSVVPGATPFTVDAGAGTLTAARGRFDLRRNTNDRLSLVAVKGRASVSAGPTKQVLTQGERLQTDNDRTPAIDQPDLAVTEAWHDGRVAFHEDTLSVVVAEANRYSVQRLVIADPRAAALRVSGMYRMGDNAALGRALSELLAIRIRQVDGAILLGA
jgi:transmembrane sensor